ncbi:MAG: hypothetical protein Q9210_004072 [Variospora velana]
MAGQAVYFLGSKQKDQPAVRSILEAWPPNMPCIARQPSLAAKTKAASFGEAAEVELPSSQTIGRPGQWTLLCLMEATSARPLYHYDCNVLLLARDPPRPRALDGPHSYYKFGSRTGLFRETFVEHWPFEAPAEATSSLDPPSTRNPTISSFGADGVLAWITSAGELLQVATCIGNRLKGVDFRNSLQRGLSYGERNEMLEIAAGAPQASGFAIGLSLGSPLEPFEKCWLHNLWPRFSYRHRGLEIRLQYWVDSRSVIQEYQIRNTGQEVVALPYIVSSDVCFREHDAETASAYQIAPGKSPARLLLFQNAQVVIRNEDHQCEMSMALFLNGQRHPLWAPSRLNENVKESKIVAGSLYTSEGLSQIDERLRRRIRTGQLVDEEADAEFRRSYRRCHDLGLGLQQLHDETNFSSHTSTLEVPPGSSQELRLVFHIAPFSQSGKDQAELHSAPHAETTSNDGDHQHNDKPMPDAILDRVRTKQRSIIEKSMRIDLNGLGPEGRRQISTLIHEHLEVGAACATLNLIGEARYHFLTACLIAEQIYKQDSYFLSYVRFKYGRFLFKYGWCSTALQVVEPLFHTLSTHKSKSARLGLLRAKVQLRLASMYLETNDLSKAVAMYARSMPNSGVEGEVLDQASAPYVERIAWAQVKGEEYEAAFENYMLLFKSSTNDRQIILSNLGFIQRKLGHLERAQSFFKEALDVSDALLDSNEQLYARSGLYACLRLLGVNPEEHVDIAKSLVQNVDFILPAYSASSLGIPIKYKPLLFACIRHLEALLTSWSISVTDNEGISGIVFVDADPLYCAHAGRLSYFQFKFLVQCQEYIKQQQPKNASQLEISRRIETICRGHLVWVFEMAKFTHTWAMYSPVGGEPTSPATSADGPSETFMLQGAFNFAKLWLYLRTWSHEWEFALKQLHSKLDAWLLYLRNSQHMGNLWVERHKSVDLQPYDTIASDSVRISKMIPEYRLSDFAMLWLVMKALKRLIDLIGIKGEMSGRLEEDPVRYQFNQVRRTLEDYQDTLGHDVIRSNILKTFIPKSDLSSEYRPGRKAVKDPKGNTLNTTLPLAQAGASKGAPPLDDPVTETANTLPDAQVGEPHRQALILIRAVDELVFTVQPGDLAVLEATSAAFFTGLDAQIWTAWQETVSPPHEQYVRGLQDPRQIALTLLAAKCGYISVGSSEEAIEQVCCDRLAIALDDAGQITDSIAENDPVNWSVANYEPMSVLLGGLFEECRLLLLPHANEEHHGPLQDTQVPQASQLSESSPNKQGSMAIPHQVCTIPKLARKDVIDTEFQPDWMYHYPTYIHKLPLQIDTAAELKKFESWDSLENAVVKWKAANGFSTTNDYPRVFPPHVADSGSKERQAFNDGSMKRHMDIDWYPNAAGLYNRLFQPRTFDQAKKRLIEFTGHDFDTALICWLTSTEDEKPNYQWFYHRHVSSTSLFGERVDWKGDIWETEIHLGFYQLLSKEDNKTYPPPHLRFPSQLRVRELPRLSHASAGGEITPVTISLRFIGDLRDRSWTCVFVSSAARDYGFTGLVNEFTNGNRNDVVDREFYSEKMGQRRLLELAYVERMLNEMVQSSREVLEGFQRELDVPETRDPQSESYESIHNYSRLYSKAGEILRDVLKLLNLAVRAVEDWEKRENNRDIRSRWSKKDQARYGRKLVDLTGKCRIGLQKVRLQRDLLEEQQKLAEQRHNNLINYMSLQAARTSSQSAEDVRLFTYVNIIFLPLSFSSSLFSMGGAPQGSTISVMVPTTVVALTITILVLANMKVLERNLSFWTYKANTTARRRMKAREHSWGFPWNKISQELEEAAELQLAKPENVKRLPAQSRWWYSLFWISYAIEAPRLYMLQGFRMWETRNSQRMGHRSAITVRIFFSVLLIPLCTFIFVAQLLMVTVADSFDLAIQAVRWLKTSVMGNLSIDNLDKEGQARERLSEEEYPHSIHEKQKLSEETDSAKSTSVPLSQRLQVPPRPLRKLAHKLKPSSDGLGSLEPRPSGFDQKEEALNLGEKSSSDEDGWGITLDKKSEDHAIPLPPRAQSFTVHRRLSNASYKEEPSWWARLKLRRRSESRCAFADKRTIPKHNHFGLTLSRIHAGQILDKMSTLSLFLSGLLFSWAQIISGRPTTTSKADLFQNLFNILDLTNASLSVTTIPSDFHIERAFHAEIPFLPEACLFNIIAGLRDTVLGDFDTNMPASAFRSTRFVSPIIKLHSPATTEIPRKYVVWGLFLTSYYLHRFNAYQLSFFSLWFNEHEVGGIGVGGRGLPSGVATTPSPAANTLEIGYAYFGPHTLGKGAVFMTVISALMEAAPPSAETRITQTWINFLHGENCIFVVVPSSNAKAAFTYFHLVELLGSAADFYEQNDRFGQLEMNVSVDGVRIAQAAFSWREVVGEVGLGLNETVAEGIDIS